MNLKNWFNTPAILLKRKEIADLIYNLSIDCNKDAPVNIPTLKFPSLRQVDYATSKPIFELNKEQLPTREQFIKRKNVSKRKICSTHIDESNKKKI